MVVVVVDSTVVEVVVGGSVVVVDCATRPPASVVEVVVVGDGTQSSHGGMSGKEKESPNQPVLTVVNGGGTGVYLWLGSAPGVVTCPQAKNSEPGADWLELLSLAPALMMMYCV